ncbi:MAG: transglutaminase-like cysteine peptidase [Brucellaceae bacterium]|nr:transglutaminase-like cysteine peptidase [Brucellaceae bacterium]
MGHKLKFLLSAAALALVPQIAAANSFMMSNGRTTQPVGHYELCQQMPTECRQVTQARKPVELTRKLWAKIVDVNNLVNTMVTPRTDQEIWGVEERWSYPTQGIGDCEDYVLEKRRLLMKAGIPAGNLMITVVRQPNGDGHAVLTARTSLGDFVLDNLEPRVLAWTDTQYRYLKRQSDQNSGVWVSIEDARQVAVGSVRRN